MKKAVWFLFIALAFQLPALAAKHGRGDSGKGAEIQGTDQSQPEVEGGGHVGKGHAARQQPAVAAQPGKAAKAPAQSKTVRIHLGHSRQSSAAPQADKAREKPTQGKASQPGDSEGWKPVAEKPAPSHGPQGVQQEGKLAHHHPDFTPKEIKGRLKKLGVTQVPGHITERAEILDADRAHSLIRYPEKDPEGRVLARPVTRPKDFSAEWVRGHMTTLEKPGRVAEIQEFGRQEHEPGRFYWHGEAGSRWCHHVDEWGFHWYGWYVGTQCFWTRYYWDRWWFFDTALGRWCFWNSGFWWWQDPWHVGDLYVYAGGQYVPATSAASSQAVAAVEEPNPTIFRSPDDTRMVKLMPGNDDAFLYDTALPPAFNPVYLASKVQAVKFSATLSGGPLLIMLTLSDGTTDQFDDLGHPLNFREAIPEGQP